MNYASNCNNLDSISLLYASSSSSSVPNTKSNDEDCKTKSISSILLSIIVSYTVLPIDLAKVVNSYIGLFIYRFGGFNFTFSVIPTSMMMDCNTPKIKWGPVQDMPTSRRGASAAMTNQRYIYVTGGCSGKGEEISTVECYDTLQNSWKIISSMQQTRSFHCTVSCDNKIFVLGGSDNSWYIVATCDPEKQKWLFISSMNVPRSSSTAVAINDNIYIFGGHSTTGPHTVYNNGLLSCEYYNTKTFLWNFTSDMPDCRLFGQSVALNNDIIAIVGGENQRGPMDDIFFYVLKTNAWTSPPKKILPTPLSVSTNAFSIHVLCEISQIVIVSANNPKKCWSHSTQGLLLDTEEN